MENLRQVVENYCSQHDVQALSVCIEKNGENLFKTSWGKTSEKGKKVNEDTLFTIGSVSKVFTTLAILKLQEQGKLNLDDPVYKLMPQFTMKDERYEQITVRMLLNHSAGFYGNVPKGKYTLEPNREYVAQVLDFMSQSVLKDEPGKFSVYCNDCFSVSEALIETLSEKSYAEYIEDVILNPLNMQHTEFPDHEIREGRIVYAKSPLEREFPQEYVNGIGSGGIYSTPQDLCILMNAINNREILTKENHEEMDRLQVPNKMEIERLMQDSYGLGWDNVELNTVSSYGLKAMAKSGSTYGFGSYVIACPEAKLSAAIVMSMTEGSPSTLLKTLFTQVLESLGYKKQIKKLPKMNCVSDVSGYYGNSDGVFKVSVQGNSLTIENLVTQITECFEKQNTEWKSENVFMGKENPSLIFAHSEGTDYLIVEYDQTAVEGLRQRVLFASKLKLNKKEIQFKAAQKTMIMDNECWMQRSLDHLPMILSVEQIEDIVTVPYPLRIQDENHAEICIEVPGNNSREMMPVVADDEGITLGMYHYIDVRQIPDLITTTFKIENGKTVWFKANNSLDNLRMDGRGRCIMLDSKGKLVFDSEISWYMPEDLDGLYLGFMGKDGTTITVEISE